jgi:hypothetical protein
MTPYLPTSVIRPPDQPLTSLSRAGASQVPRWQSISSRLSRGASTRLHRLADELVGVLHRLTSPRAG